MQSPELSGILNIDKPSGPSSHDVVLHVRRITGQKKVGHAGTLDPLATGVLLLCLGQATRVSEYLMDGDKVYRARIRLGVTTDSYDADGRITARQEVLVAREQFEQQLAHFVGDIEQTPPMYSAIKHQGVALHRLARRGETVDPPVRQIHIHSIQLLEWSLPDAEIEVHCSKGTYIRSLAHDLGQRLGCGAHVAALARLASGPFRLESAVTVEDLARAWESGEGPQLLLPLDVALAGFPAVALDPTAASRVVLGQRIELPPGAGPQADVCRAYGLDGGLLALLRRQTDGLWQPMKVFGGQAGDADHP